MEWRVSEFISSVNLEFYDMCIFLELCNIQVLNPFISYAALCKLMQREISIKNFHLSLLIDQADYDEITTTISIFLSGRYGSNE